ncbi:transposase [Microcystis aeruginosa NIES-3807]|uniref:Transposase n=1 Tax=Microcystis aeruginosa NIES-3807 TaxID=2517785 RepID=A0AAD3B004_MICAE|nr:transposase [Microcystis aeruginosa NIES-3807]
MHQFIGRQSLNNGSAEFAERLVEEAGDQVVFLPKYSPDLNDIEHDFIALKRARMYDPVGTPLDEIIRTYCVP